MRRRHARPAERGGDGSTGLRDRDPLRVVLRIYGDDGALTDWGRASVRKLSQSRAVLGDLGFSRQVLPVHPQLIGIRFRSGRLGPVELAARALEFSFRADGVVAVLKFFECQEATLALLRRTFNGRKKGPLLTISSLALGERPASGNPTEVPGR